MSSFLCGYKMKHMWIPKVYLGWENNFYFTLPVNFIKFSILLIFSSINADPILAKHQVSLFLICFLVQTKYLFLVKKTLFLPVFLSLKEWLCTGSSYEFFYYLTIIYLSSPPTHKAKWPYCCKYIYFYTIAISSSLVKWSCC